MKDNDFGFAFHDSGTPVTEDYKAKYETLYGMIMPFLKNLLVSPEKDTILWPNRVAKVNEFITKINSIDKKE